MNLKNEMKENINLWGNILGGLISFFILVSIPILVHAYNSDRAQQTAEITAHSDNNVSALKQAITENFELKTDHATDIGKITQWNVQLQDSQKEMGAKMDDVKLNIQKLTDTVEMQNKTK